MSRAALLLVLLLAWPVAAADGGLIRPGETADEGERAR